jgi:uncharacterized protein YndB with AHSA1/START domain
MRDREPVRRAVVLPARPERVWEALTDAEQLSAWFGARVDLAPRPGATARFRWTDGRERGAVVETVERHRLLTLRWLPFERLPHGGTRAVGPGRIAVTLTPEGQGTLLTVVEWGQPAGHPGPGGILGPPSARGPAIRDLTGTRP